MPFLVATIVVCWIVGYFLLRNAGNLSPLQEMRQQQKIMETADTGDARRAAARQVLELIERYDLAGVLVDDAREAAEIQLRGWRR